MEQVIAAECPECGHAIKVPERLARKTLKCKKCGAQFELPTADGRHQQPLDAIFDRDRFRFHQKLTQLHVHKQVLDAQDRELLHVEEPRPWPGRFFAMLAALAAMILSVLLLYAFAVSATPKPGTTLALPARLLLLAGLLALLALMAIGPTLAFHLVTPRFAIDVFKRSEGRKADRILRIRTEHPAKGLKEIVRVEDGDGALLGRFTRNWLTGRIFRNNWRCFDAEDRLLFAGREAPTKRVLAHRAAWVYCFIPFVRGVLLRNLEPPWEVFAPGTDGNLAPYRRPSELTGRAEIDWSRDSEKAIDRRLGLCFGLLLDSGRWRLLDAAGFAQDAAGDAKDALGDRKG